VHRPQPGTGAGCCDRHHLRRVQSRPAGSSCGAPLGPGDNCSLFAPIASGVACACTATAAGSAKHLRGTLILYDTVDPSDSEPIRTGELR
jgi:hypothetical protein